MGYIGQEGVFNPVAFLGFLLLTNDLLFLLLQGSDVLLCAPYPDKLPAVEDTDDVVVEIFWDLVDFFQGFYISDLIATTDELADQVIELS